MKKIITIILCVLLCIGAVGGTFVLAKKLDENTAHEQPNDSSTQEKPSNDENNSSSGGENADPETVSVLLLCTYADELAVGDRIVITAQSAEYALGTTQNTSNRSAVSIEKDGDTLVTTDDVQIITLEAGTIENTFAFNVGTGYLYAPSSASNHLKTHAGIDANSCWRITIEESGVASIVAQGGSEINTLLYNPTNKIFSCYASAQEPLMIYKLVEQQN